MSNKDLGAPRPTADRVTDERSPEAGSPPSGSVPTGARFTPGPWHVERRRQCSVVLQAAGKCDGYSNRVAECPQWSPAPYPQPTPDEAFANAHLISAAPELYEALESLLIAAAMLDEPAGFDDDGDRVTLRAGMFHEARAVLAKARGQ
jgi:hypothetical protein